MKREPRYQMFEELSETSLPTRIRGNDLKEMQWRADLLSSVLKKPHTIREAMTGEVVSWHDGLRGSNKGMGRAEAG